MIPFRKPFNYFIIKLVYSSTRLVGLAGFSLIGIRLISILGVVLLFLFRENPVMQLIMGIVNELWMLFIFLIVILHMFQYFILLFITSIWNGIFGVFLIRDAIMKWKNGERKHKINFKEKRVKIAAIALSAIILSGIVFSISPIMNNKTYTFEISDTQAQNYELVVYYPNTIGGVNACRDANATLSFNMPQRHFNVSDPFGIEMANLVAYANTQGVPIEIWPLFDTLGYHYISAVNTEYMWDLYNDFHNWTDYYNITVEYILWDIEDYVHAEDITYDGWARDIPGLNSLGNLTMYGASLNENLRIWPEIIAEWKAMAVQAELDGHIMRATVNPSAFEYADGDLDYSILSHMPSLELLPEFQYISSMYYTGCEYGMNPFGLEWVYGNIQMMKTINPGPLAVCIGCLNYIQYQNISAVKNDVILSSRCWC